MWRKEQTGVTGNESMTVDTAKENGRYIISKMEDQNVTSYSFKRKDEAVTLATKNAKPGDNEFGDIDPQVLFQRLIDVSDSTLDNTEEMFKYELNGRPSSLFDSGGLMMEAEKPSLANTIWQMGKCGAEDGIGESVKYVLDGGSLVQRIPWKCGASFDNMCKTTQISSTSIMEKLTLCLMATLLVHPQKMKLTCVGQKE